MITPACGLALGKKLALLLAVALATFGPGRIAFAGPESDAFALRQKQQAQQKARTMARELISSILDVQLQQLRENGLEELPLYGEIQSMKKNINQLVDDEMQKVVDLLVKAQQGPKADRDQAFKDARTTIREVVLKLSIERQNLLRRLKTAEIVAQVRRLIQLESTCLTVTEKLPEQAPAQREKKALATIEDQRDVRHLYLQLEDVLRDVGRWGGAMGTGAAEGLKKLGDAGVRKELDAAGKNLEGTLFAEAAKNQTNVIAGLRTLLERMESVQGLLNTERQQALDGVRDLARRQEALREQTKKADLTNEAVREPLVKEQAAIRKDLEKLNDLAQNPVAKTLLEQAKEAAYETTAKLFDAKLDEAITEQGKVLGNLAELENQLKVDAIAEADKSADEYARQVADLEQAKKDVMKLQEQQAQVEKTVEKAQAEKTSPEAAATQEQQLSAETAKVSDNKDLPKAVDVALAQAQSDLKKAADELQKPADADRANPEKAQSVEQASEALQQARAEIETALADTKRKQLAVKIGELARASESLERAAAAEREIARGAEAAAQDKGLTAEQARDLKKDQADVEAVARKVAEGTEKTAPEVSKMLKEAGDDTQAATQQLTAAEQRPGESSKPAALQAAEEARRAANKLEDAATALREEFGKVAEALAREAETQKQPVAAAREAVEAALKTESKPIAERMADLKAAAEQIHAAQKAQQKAAGRPEAAAAMELADEISAAQAQQEAAATALKDMTDGKVESPLDAAKAQTQVGEKLKEIARQAAERPQGKQAKADKTPDPLAEALNKAQASASNATKAMTDGDMPKAQAAQADAKQALEKAQEIARAETNQAQAAPAGKPDAAAQKQVAEKAAAAQKMTQADAPTAAMALTQAEAAAAEAAGELAEAKPANEAQETTAEKLGEAQKQVAEALQQLGEQARKELQGKSQKATELAQQTSQVDAAANAAIQQAENKAEQAAGPMPEPADAGQADAAVDQALERAAANLQAREDRLEQDKQIAQAIAQLARQQQKAATQIAKTRDSLPARPQAADAQQLADAQQQFAQAQRATGQGAEQVSGQEQVANVPIREALEIASNLGQPKPGAAPMNDAGLPMPADGQPPEGQPAEAGMPEGSPMPGKPMNGSPMPGSPMAGSPMPGSPMEGQASGQPPASPDLGTGLVPNSPEVTAKMMAGPEAEKALAALMPRSQLPPDVKVEEGSGQAQPDDEQATSQQPPMPGQESAKQSKKPGQKSSKTAADATSKQGQPMANDKVKDGPFEVAPDSKTANDSRTNTEKRDSDAATMAFEKETWFAKLPPDLRRAMRARAQRRAPKAYEERLRRYFESLD